MLVDHLLEQVNQEAADAIYIDGGWKGMPYVYQRLEGVWLLVSAGGFPVREREIDKFVKAVSNLRRENFVGESQELRKTSRTGDLGRKVSVMRRGKPMAEFVIGKHPRGDWNSYFIRRADEDKIYRTKTVNNTDAPPTEHSRSFGGGRRGFDWAQYCNSVFKTTETLIWNLDDVLARFRDPRERGVIAGTAHELVMASHTYAHRVRQVCNLLTASEPSPSDLDPAIPVH